MNGGGQNAQPIADITVHVAHSWRKTTEVERASNDMTNSAAPKSPVRNFVHEQLLERTREIIRLCQSNEYGSAMRSAQYHFLWNASIADAEALESAYDLMLENGACYDMPIDINAAFGRILIMAIASSNPKKAAEAFETLILLYSDPGEADYIKQEILTKL